MIPINRSYEGIRAGTIIDRSSLSPSGDTSEPSAGPSAGPSSSDYSAGPSEPEVTINEIVSTILNILFLGATEAFERFVQVHPRNSFTYMNLVNRVGNRISNGEIVLTLTAPEVRSIIERNYSSFTSKTPAKTANDIYSRYLEIFPELQNDQIILDVLNILSDYQDYILSEIGQVPASNVEPDVSDPSYGTDYGAGYDEYNVPDYPGYNQPGYAGEVRTPPAKPDNTMKYLLLGGGVLAALMLLKK